MAELRVDTGGLRDRANEFEAEGQDHHAVAAGDAAGVESDIAAFGEIKMMLHDQYRAVHALKQRAWNDHGKAVEDHAAKINTAATGYDNTESSAAASLGGDSDGTGGTLGPNGVGRVDNIQSGISGPYLPNQSPDRSVTAQMPPGLSADAPVHAAPPSTTAQMPPGVGPDAPVPFDNHLPPPPGPSPGPMPPPGPGFVAQPLPGQPGGGTWADRAPFPGDANHPPHSGMIPSNEPPGYTNVDPWGRPEDTGADGLPIDPWIAPNRPGGVPGTGQWIEAFTPEGKPRIRGS